MDEKPKPDDVEREPTMDDLDVPSKDADEVVGGRSKTRPEEEKLGDHFK